MSRKVKAEELGEAQETQEVKTAGEPAKEPVARPTIDQLRDELEKETYRTSYNRVLRSTIFSLLVVAAAAALVAVLLLPVMRISGSSMTETLQDGDIVVALNGSHFKTGDVIAFYYNNSILIKRVIATAGDWVDIDEDGNVKVNGIELDEPYVTEKSLGNCNIEFPYQVPEGRNFVMGDHRATSVDSRNTTVGCVENGLAIGRIVLRIWPLESIGMIQ